ncbi:YciI family protein [Prosthecomicrobium sp. N25]|uniref:YciI family protein n=1 Tax=Prosthecomicrobium sp. N25 TaxID=3129254 RepID=UPI003077F77B
MTAHFLMVCRHRAGLQDVREANREAHRRHVATGGNGLARVLIGSALVGEDGTTPVGNFGVMEAANREAVEAFAATDPYALAGLVETIEITALPAQFQAHRIDPMTPPFAS